MELSDIQKAILAELVDDEYALSEIPEILARSGWRGIDEGPRQVMARDALVGLVEQKWVEIVKADVPYGEPTKPVPPEAAVAVLNDRSLWIRPSEGAAQPYHRVRITGPGRNRFLRAPEP